MATTHIVEQGEYLSLIARRYGFANWKTIWEHPENAALRKNHPNPNVIHAGDRIFIPDKRPKEEVCGTGETHHFRMQLPGRILLRLVVRDHDQLPLADQPYKLTVGEQVFAQKTSPDGVIEHWVPVGETTGSLTLEQFGLSWPVQIGNLDPLRHEENGESIATGVQGRLNNLGFPCGPVDGVIGPRTSAALKRFQRRILGRDDANGELDGDTLDALMKHHET